MISFDRVTKRYPGGHEALKGISFRIDPGKDQLIMTQVDADEE